MRLRGPALVYLLVVVLGGLVVGVPFATRDRPQVTSVPIARPTHAVAPVAVGAQPVCVGPVELGPDANAVAIQALSAGPPLRIDVAGQGGYRASATVPGGYRGGTGFTVPFRAAPREMAGGIICFQATAAGTAQLLGGTTDRELGTARTVVGGQAAPVQLAVALRDVPQRSLLARVGQLAGRAGELRPFPVVGWLLVLFAVLTVVGVPALTLAAASARRR